MAFSNEGTKKFVAFCTVILFLQVVASLTKKGTGDRRPPEDKIISGDDELQPLTSSDDEENDEESQQARQSNNRRSYKRFTQRERWRRIAMNDLENIPLGLIIIWVNIICESNAYVTSICAVLFTASRVSYTLFYVYSLQPFRSIAYTIGALSIFTVAINLLIGSLN
eukprot:UN00956